MHILNKIPPALIFGSLIALSPLSLTAEINQPTKIDENMEIIPLGEGLYIHTTWHNFEQFGRYPCNGLIYVQYGEALLLDTPVTNEQTEQLVHVIQNQLQAEVTLFIPNHFHNNCMGGLQYLQSIGVPSLSLELTRQICRNEGLPVPDKSFIFEQILH